MTPDLLTGGSLLLNFAFLAIILVIRAVPKNKRRLAAWLWSSAKAQEQKLAAWQSIEQEQRDYEAKLLRRAEDEPTRLVQMGE